MTETLPTLSVGNAVAPTGQWTAAPNGALTLIGAVTQDNAWGGVNDNSTGDYDQGWALADMPSDFASMSTLSIQLRYGWDDAPGLSDWTALEARIMSGTTVLAGSTSGGGFQSVATNITTTTPTNSAVISFAYVNADADKSTWDAGVLEIRIGRNRNKGGSTAEQRVYATQATGTYAAAVASDELTASGGATTPSVTASGDAAQTVSATGAATAPAPDAQGAVTQTVTATGAVETPSVLASGSVGDNDTTATGSATIAPAQASGSAAQAVSASGTVELPASQASGAAAQTVNATGDAVTPQATVAGIAGQTVSATGSPTMPAVTAFGDAGGVIPTEATGNASVPATQATGQAAQTVNASGGAVIPIVQASGAARLVVRAAGNVNAAPVETDGEATQADQAAQAQGAIVLSLPEATGAARVTVFASGGAVTAGVNVFGAVGSLSVRRFQSPNYTQGGSVQDSNRGGILAPSIRSGRII